jgi:hypothetical protein
MEIAAESNLSIMVLLPSHIRIYISSIQTLDG